MRKHVREAYLEFMAVAEGYDCTVARPSVTKGRHLKWIVEHASGHSKFLLTGQTPSDHRSIKNSVKNLKHLCRELVNEARSSV